MLAKETGKTELQIERMDGLLYRRPANRAAWSQYRIPGGESYDADFEKTFVEYLDIFVSLDVNMDYLLAIENAKKTLSLLKERKRSMEAARSIIARGSR
jgi:hypothetical protein